MSSLLPYTLYIVNAFKWRTTFFVCKHILILMNLYNNSLYGIICMCAGDIYTYICVCVRIRVCVTHICVHTYMNFARVYVSCFHMLVQFVCVRVCVFPSEMECVLFYSRKKAHRANVICCIMYSTLNKFHLILSYLMSHGIFLVNGDTSVFRITSLNGLYTVLPLRRLLIRIFATVFWFNIPGIWNEYELPLL